MTRFLVLIGKYAWRMFMKVGEDANNERSIFPLLASPPTALSHFKTAAACLLLACLCISAPLSAQEDSTAQEVPKNWELRGYAKNLQTWFFFNNFPTDNFLQDNLLHQRLNFRWFPSEQLTFSAELRTRAFFGDLVKLTPNYADLVDDANNDYFDLSKVLLNKNSWVIHTMLDRLYFEYTRDKWEVRLGRQRINWGISTVWNPNDIFNAFAFTDFDYEERPGSDALRVKYYTGFASSLELAVKAFDNWDEAVVAGLWKFNRGSYDIQLLAGFAEGDLALGGGWAGNLGNASFKGEATWFKPLEEDKDPSFALTAGIDYSFGNSLYVQGGYLYNSRGALKGDVTGLFGFQLSAKNLYPFRHAVFLQSAYPFTPLLNGSLALIYSPVESQAIFLNPVLTLSIAQNWDLDMVGQVVMNKNQEDKFVSPLQVGFLRLKVSF